MTSKTPEKPRPESRPDANGEEMPGLGDLERVRSILIGSHSREVDRRLARLESHVDRALDGLREAWHDGVLATRAAA